MASKHEPRPEQSLGQAVCTPSASPTTSETVCGSSSSLYTDRYQRPMSRYCRIVTFTVIASRSIFCSDEDGPPGPAAPPSADRFEMMCFSTSSSGRSANAYWLCRIVSNADEFSSGTLPS
uniref:Uncharacterized protein n=1 Tax=Anopheles coluzzii TaxID=1518534 RepID=A0A8W7Q3Q3_ANOCL